MIFKLGGTEYLPINVEYRTAPECKMVAEQETI